MLAAGVLLGLHIWAISVQLPRALEYDEAEYLHASWLIDQGARLYRDFMEDHPAFLYLLLAPLRPESGAESSGGVLAWAIRGRLLMAVFGTLAVTCAAAIAWRVTRSTLAALVTAAFLLGSGLTWQRSIADIRNDPPTLLLFWAGTLLLLWNGRADLRGALRAGTGMALVVAAEAWNPKWPLEGAVLAIVFSVTLVRLSRRSLRLVALTLLPPVLAGGLLALMISSASTLREYVFFNFELKSWTFHAARTDPWLERWFEGLEPFAYTTWHFRGVLPLAGVAIAAVAAVWSLRKRGVIGLDGGQALVVVALAVSALVEIRFVYSYPRLWSQYYLMWAFALAVVYGIAVLALITAIQERFRLARRPVSVRMAGFVVAAFGVAVGATGLLGWTRVSSLDASYWRAQSYLHDRLREGDRVWMRPDFHPITARDASYYWYSFPDLVPAALRHRREHPDQARFLPAIDEDDLPPCAILEGRGEGVRFIGLGPWLAYLPRSCACSEDLLRSGRLAPTPVFSLFEVKQADASPADSLDGPARRAFERFRTLFPDLCSLDAPIR